MGPVSMSITGSVTSTMSVASPMPNTIKSSMSKAMGKTMPMTVCSSISWTVASAMSKTMRYGSGMDNRCRRCSVWTGDYSSSWSTGCSSRFICFDSCTKSMSISNVIYFSASAIDVSKSVGSFFVSMSVTYFGS